MKSLVGKVKDVEKGIAVGAAIGLAIFVYSPKAEAINITNGFVDLMGDPNYQAIVQMRRGPPVEDYDNLKIRDANGVASVVSKDGTDVWRIGFVKYDSGNLLVNGNMSIGGYANNDNCLSNDFPDIFGGWCTGHFYSPTFVDGESAKDVAVVRDANGDGIGSIDWEEVIPGQWGWRWNLGDDDTRYWTKDIEFNGKQGGIEELGPFNFYEGTKILPQMIIDARAPRSGPAGVNDLEALSYYWLCADCNPVEGEDPSTYDCEGADWNYDGEVNFKDLAYMAQEWNPAYVSEN